MFTGLIAAAFLISTVEDPIDSALMRAEPPASLRAAFTVELTDGETFREVRFDPRLTDDRWSVTKTEGRSAELDYAVRQWGSQAAPDGWLFADDLRASMGRIVEADDVGEAWRLQFQHQPSDNDGPLDIWAAEHLAGVVWMEPVNAYFLRIDYTALEPFSAPNGGTVETYNHSYFLHQDPEFGISYITAFQMDVRGRFLTTDVAKSYGVRVTEIDLFFATTADEALFRQKRLKDQRAGSALFLATN